MQQHADARTPGVLAQLLLFCQLLHALVHAGRGPAGRNTEFHALASCPAIPYAAAEADVQQIAEKDGLSTAPVIKLNKQSKKSNTGK